jgi:hypothetical protein
MQKPVQIRAWPSGGRAIRTPRRGKRCAPPDSLRVDDGFSWDRVNLEIAEIGDQLVPSAS